MSNFHYFIVASLILFYAGGSKPNLADLAVFGVLRPIRHLRAGKDMVQNTKIGEWYDRMETAVGDASRIDG
jgi:microsomal prostaglandin-E synthase 2